MSIRMVKEIEIGCMDLICNQKRDRDIISPGGGRLRRPVPIPMLFDAAICYCLAVVQL